MHHQLSRRSASPFLVTPLRSIASREHFMSSTPHVPCATQSRPELIHCGSERRRSIEEGAWVQGVPGGQRPGETGEEVR